MIKRIVGKLAAAVGCDSGGAALITSLLFMVILTALGMASIMTASTEIMVSRNYRLNILALDYANAGVQAALAKMDSTLINTNVRAYDETGPDYFPGDPDETWSAKSSEIPGVGMMNFSAIISYKKEGPLHYRHMLPSDPEYATAVDDDQVVAYSQDCGYNKSPMDDLEHAFPVYVIESRGRVVSGGKEMAQALVTAEVAKDTIDLIAGAPVVSGACITMPSAVTVTGLDTSGCGEDKTGMTANDAACTPGNTSGVTGSGGPNDFVADAGVDMDGMFGRPVDDIIAMSTKLPPENDTDPPLVFPLPVNLTITGKTYGSAASPVIYYANNSNAKNFVMNNCGGFGILIVDGPLDITGTFTWEGMIYVRGVLTLGGGGSAAKNITGVIAATDGIVFNGANIEIAYHQCNLDTIMDVAFKSKLINWVRQFDYEATYE